MIDLHIQEVLGEVRDAISEHLEGVEHFEDPEDRFGAAEELLQDILDRISQLIEMDV